MSSGASQSEQTLQTEQAAQVQQEMTQQQTQYANSEALFAQLSPLLQNEIQNPTGFTAQEMADLNASNIKTTGAQYANVQKQLNLANAGSNMAGLTSGAAASETAALKGAAAGTVASNATNVQLANAQLEQQNKQNATSELLSLQSGQAGAAIGTGNVENTAQNNAFNQANIEQQQSSQLMNGILGGLINTGIGAATGGLGSAVATIGSGNFGW
jgi:hypothetical protein